MASMFNLEEIIEKIIAESGCYCEAYPNIINDETILIPADQLHAVMSVLRDHFGIYHLSTITAQVRESEADESIIELFYHFWYLYQPGDGRGISLMIQLPLNKPNIDSIISQIPGADFYEREVAEMFGVTFKGRAETPKLLLPDQWDKGPPFIRSEVSDE